MSKPNRKVVGRLLPKGGSNLTSDFERWVVNQNGYNERLGLIPSEVSPSRLQSIKEDAARGHLGPLYELYRKMESTDAYYGGLVASLLSSIGGMPLKVIAAEATSSQDQAIADDYLSVVEENLAHLDTHCLVKDFARAQIYGARLFELKYALKEYPYGKKIWMVDDVRPISGASLKMDKRRDSATYGELMIVTEKDPEGRPVERYKRNKLIRLEDGEGRGFYDAIGAARRCVAWWITKVYAQLWWTEFVEVYGQPLRIAKYPEGAGSKSRATMERFLKTLGKSAYGLFPQGMELQLVEANKSGTVTTYQDLIKMANNEIAITLVGQAETTGTQKYGSRAKAEVMDGIRYETLQDIGHLVQKGFKSLVQAVIEVNYGEDANPRLFPRIMPVVINPMDGLTKAQTFQAIQQMGFPIPVDHIAEQMGIPRAKVGEQVLVANQIVDYNGKSTPSVNDVQKEEPEAEPTGAPKE